MAATCETRVVGTDRGDRIIAVIRQHQNGITGVGEMAVALLALGVALTAECLAAVSNGEE